MTTEAKKDRKPRRTLTLKDRVAELDARIEARLADVRDLRAKRQALLDAAKAESDAIAAEIAQVTE